MKKFRFRFQTILDIRARELEKAELKVAEAQKDVFNAEKKLHDFKNEVKQNQKFLKQCITAGFQIDIFTVHNCQNYLLSLDRRIDKQYKNIDNAKQKLDKVRQEMLLIRQKKLMMDKIKEKDFKNYIREFEMQDLKMIDEIATSRFK